MKYVALTITTVLFLMGGASLAFGFTQLGRAVLHVAEYEPVLAEEVYLPGDPYGFFDGLGYCWNHARYQVGSRSYLASGGCADPTADGRIRLRYRKSDPAQTVVDDVSTMIASGIRWIAFGGVLGWCASAIRSRSVSLTGRAHSTRKWTSAGWALIAMLGFTAAAARDIADVREGFCGSRRALLTNSVVRSITRPQGRLPSEWLANLRADADEQATFTGSRECLAATQLDELAAACSGGFHILMEIDIGSPVCDLTGTSRYKVDVEVLPGKTNQSIKVRYLDAR